MKLLIAAMVASCCAALAIAAGGSPGPSAMWPIKPIAPPLDRPYPGEISLQVDASDFERRIVRVHEHVSGIGTDSVLLYPKWLPGTHAPEGTIDRFAGLKITAAGAPVPWVRDPVDVFAFRLHPAAGIKAIDIEFQYLSPTSSAVGDPEISREMMALEWNEVVLYPAGYFTRRIPVSVSLTLPADWQFATALQTTSSSGAQVQFQRTELNTLVDSPVYAGRYFSRLDLDAGNAVPVHLNLFADRPEFLKVKPEQLDAYRALVQQAYRLFGSHHYAHYDFLYSLSDQISDAGLEHHQSSENGGHPESFTDWDKFAYERDLLPHEFTHSWNGKFRRPADLWTPNFNVPMQDSLLWVYEGQTEYWGHVLTARAALRTHQQALDELALRAAYYQIQTGRQWRSVQDTTSDEIINPRRPMSWRDWQRYEDYYSEGSLIWLDADTLIRERSQGKRSLDDFARAFFGIDDGSIVPITYTFDEVVKALNAVEPYDWAAFLHQRIDRVDTPVPLDGLRRGGYKLVYNDTPNDLLKDMDEQRKRLTLTYSIGIQLSADDKDGTIDSVIWNSPAFKAGLIESAQILAVNGIAYSDKVIEDAISAAQKSHTPIQLIVKTGERYRVASLEYYDGLRYPHLERDPAEPARLDDILKARP
ncbi:MAG: M61 family metallopeptidase [Steroidobacteraceae bacterium]